MRVLPGRRPAVERRLDWEMPLWEILDARDSDDSGVRPGSWLPIFYACLRLICKRISAMPVRVLNDEDEELPVPYWLDQPSEWIDKRVMLEQAVYGLLMHGNWTILPQRDRSGRIASLVIPDPTQVKVEQHTATGRPEDNRWVLVVSGRAEFGEHRYAPWLTMTGDPTGLSAVGALRSTGRVGSGSIDYLDKTLSRGMVQQFVVKTGDATEETLDALSKVISAKYSGMEASFTPMALPGEMDITPISFNMRDFQFMEMGAWSDIRICAVFGVDPSIMGIATSGSQLTYQNVLQREGNLWRDALEPCASIIEKTLSSLLPKGQRVDLDQRKYLQGTVVDKATMAVQMSQMTVAGQHCYTVDEVRAVQGYAPNPDLPEAIQPAAPDTGDDSGDDTDEEIDDADNTAT